MTNPDFHGLNKTELEEMAAMLQSEAGVLERSAETLEEVVAENERGGFESFSEDTAVDAYRRLAVYLRRDADEALELATAQPVTEIVSRAASWEWDDEEIPWGKAIDIEGGSVQEEERCEHCHEPKTRSHFSQQIFEDHWECYDTGARY